MIRLASRWNAEYGNPLLRFKGLYECIAQEKPDILYIHGLQFWNIIAVLKYLNMHKKVQVYVDNHADYSNSGQNILSRRILHPVIWRHYAKKLNKYVTKFFGVLPARVDWLVNMYGLPQTKCELLVMGADDDELERVEREGRRDTIRRQYSIRPDDFLIMTGGKIDSAKWQTLNLMKAVKALKNPNVRLIVFGSISSEIRDKVDELCDGHQIQYIGWAKGSQAYDFFSAADLVVFPGRHSVYWEQVAGMGIPMICKYWEGTTHVDLGGNIVFLRQDSVTELTDVLGEITGSEDVFEGMKAAAHSSKRKGFLYSRIARKSIGVAD